MDTLVKFASLVSPVFVGIVYMQNNDLKRRQDEFNTVESKIVKEISEKIDSNMGQISDKIENETKSISLQVQGIVGQIASDIGHLHQRVSRLEAFNDASTLRAVTQTSRPNNPNNTNGSS